LLICAFQGDEALGGLLDPREDKVAIIMFDTRPLGKKTGGVYAYEWAQAAQLNALFACKHGYSFRYYLDQDKFFSEDCLKLETCREYYAGSITSKATWPSKLTPRCFASAGKIPRAAPWCKLAAVADALNEFDVVVYIDSDAFFHSDDRSLPIRDVIERGQENGVGYHPASGSTLPLSKGGDAVVWFPPNDPFGPRLNSGLHIWRNNNRAWNFLRQWWNVDASRVLGPNGFGGWDSVQNWNLHHPFEQVMWCIVIWVYCVDGFLPLALARN
jgi:hypothetical protein